MIILTKPRGYDFFAASSAMQKAIRRNDPEKACYFAVELARGYSGYVWKRLMIVSAEDIADHVATEMVSLYNAFTIVEKRTRANPDKEDLNPMLFIIKAVLLLCQSRKSRDTDHALNFVCLNDTRITQEQAAQCLQEAMESAYVPIPGYAYDCHTQKGKRAGKTRADFFREENVALEPKGSGLFDALIP